MHVLVFDGLPIACSERMERLNMQLAAYTPTQQAQMAIFSVEVLE